MKKLSAALILYLGLVCAALAQAPIVFSSAGGSQILPVTASVTATTGAFSVTLPAAASKYTYLCGFVITSAGTTAAAVATVTTTGTISGSLNYVYTFVSAGQGVLGVSIPGCIVSSGQNQAIQISVGAGGAGTTAALNAWGYQN